MDMYYTTGQIDQTKTACDRNGGSAQKVQPRFVSMGFGPVVAATRTTFTAKAQEDMLLKYAIFGAPAPGFVNDFVIGNQSLNCSDSDIDLAVFSSFSQRVPAIGVAVDGNIQISVTVTLDANGGFAGGFSADPVDKAPKLSDQCQNLNKYFGLGSVSVPASGTAQLNAQALRDCFLSDLVVHNHTAAVETTEIVITDITVAGRSLLSGQSSDGISLHALNEFVQKHMALINTAIETNQRVIVTISNQNALTPALVGGACYAR